MKKLLFLVTMGFAASLALGASAESKAKTKKTTRKTQEISFDGSDIDGVARTPDGAYLLQKRGVKFMPLYKINRQFDQNIKESIGYLR